MKKPCDCCVYKDDEFCSCEKLSRYELYVDTYNKAYDDGYQKGFMDGVDDTTIRIDVLKADTIDECIKEIDKMFVYTDSRGNDRYASYSQINRNSIHSMLKKLKEQINE